MSEEFELQAEEIEINPFRYWPRPLEIPIGSKVMVSWGGGTNSTAMLIEMKRRGIKVDYIVFADTGAELPSVYNYIGIFNDWLKNNGMPEITIVRKTDKNGEILTIERYCTQLKCLPSIAYGFKTCSLKFKVEPSNKHINNVEELRPYFKEGKKLVKCIGYDAGEVRRGKLYIEKKYETVYPLLCWGINRKECVKIIESEGLPQPGKSSCFFCPSSRPHEIRALSCDLKKRAVAIERNADLKSIKGLGRNFSWEAVIDAQDNQAELFDEFVNFLPCDCLD